MSWDQRGVYTDSSPLNILKPAWRVLCGFLLSFLVTHSVHSDPKTVSKCFLFSVDRIGLLIIHSYS